MNKAIASGLAALLGVLLNGQEVAAIESAVAKLSTTGIPASGVPATGLPATGVPATGLPVSEYGSAARVNGVEISLFRLERHFEDYLREQHRNVAQIRNPSVFKRLKHEALEQLIDKELLWQQADRLAIQVSDAEVASTREQVASAFSSPEAFARRLQEAGFDEAGYSEYLRHEIAAERALDRLLPTVSISDEEVSGMFKTLRGHLQEAGVAGGDEAGQIALLRRVMLERRGVEARNEVLLRLRAEAQIERLLPL